MMSRRLLFVIPAVTVMLIFLNGVRTKSQDARVAKKELPQIMLHFNKHEVVVGEMVEMRQFVDADIDGPAGSIMHYVKQVGFYHRKHARIVFPNAVYGTSVRIKEVFGDTLPIGGIFSHPSYDYRTQDEKGYEFRFKPVKPGAYLLQTTWTFKNRNSEYDTIASNWAILIVNPPPNVKVDLWNGKEPTPDELEEQNDRERRFDQEGVRWKKAVNLKQ